MTPRHRNPMRSLTCLLSIASLANAMKCHSATFIFPSILGVRHLKTTTAVVSNYTGYPGFLSDSTVIVPPEAVRPFCNVTVSYTHPGHDDLVNLHIWLPLDRADWNERFMGVGGSGFVVGDVDGDHVSAGLQEGYAVASTDGGHLKEHEPDVWGLKEPGNVNWPVFFNFAYRSLHELAVIGKSVAREYFGAEPKWSYWKGCSTGGRQGLAAAQRFPGDFDGVLSMCPAVDFPAMVSSLYYPQLLMKEIGWWPSECELGEVVKAAVEACDEVDGKVDGVIGRLGECEFDVGKAQGRRFDCEGVKGTVDKRTVEIVRRAQEGLLDEEGKTMFPGLVSGAPMAGVLALTNSVCETASNRERCKGVPFHIVDGWIRLFIQKDPNFKLEDMSLEDFRDVFRKGVEEYDSIIGSSHDMRRFRQRGGKLLMWHGMSDQAITVMAGRAFYERAKKLDEERGVKTEDYWRYFEVPGVNHCMSLHDAAFPWDVLDTLRKWVEEGIAPEDLEARKFKERNGRKEIGQETMKVCLFPKEGFWDGKTWTCLKPGEKFSAVPERDEL